MPPRVGPIRLELQRLHLVRNRQSTYRQRLKNLNIEHENVFVFMLNG